MNTEQEESWKDNQSKNNKASNSFFKELLNILFSVVVAYLLFLLIRAYLFFPFQVVGPSMYPTLQDGDRLILNRLGQLDRFDVVVFPAPDAESSENNEEYVKRIIGVPGDEISYQDDELYIDGEVVEEKYLETLKEDQENSLLTPDFTLLDVPGSESLVVPEGMYLVLGDNREVSKDSRMFGLVPEEVIEGTTSLRIWPLNRIGFLEKNE
ncbi:signal peptidase I [Jeotgalibaca ciconiae]|uniref:Signal peptidase I n=1 Tax=Jeotgalibaca ciconiae TaxID=2496265 RepID=A0A3S9HDE3_9LACT|nr:signal peptidase I [Jeotgalibaca ciconiae]AZP05367.1 signal peptidase I [Jeotgalibaca ciconiae]HJB22579.1 signal peptidase I [Candidatus Jeotgalibaca pullicola]